MELSLTKLPWYAQVGAFVALGVGAVRGVLLLLRDAGAGRARRAARRSSSRCAPTSPRASTTAKQLPEFEAEVSDLEARLENLRAVLPEEKDAADLLRRMQTVAHAVQSRHQELQAGARRHQAAARRVADQPGARGHVSQPGDLLRPRRQVHPHREHHRPGREGTETGPAMRTRRLPPRASRRPSCCSSPRAPPRDEAPSRRRPRRPRKPCGPPPRSSSACAGRRQRHLRPDAGARSAPARRRRRRRRRAPHPLRRAGARGTRHAAPTRPRATPISPTAGAIRS